MKIVTVHQYPYVFIDNSRSRAVLLNLDDSVIYLYVLKYVPCLDTLINSKFRIYCQNTGLVVIKNSIVAFNIFTVEF